jgi:hypothetical protein
MLSDQVIQCVQRSRAIRIEDLAWACPDHTWSQILEAVKQLSKLKEISLVCRKHGGLVVMPSNIKSQVQKYPHYDRDARWHVTINEVAAIKSRPLTFSRSADEPLIRMLKTSASRTTL